MVETIRRHPTAFAGMGFLLLFVVMVPLMVTTNAAGPGGPPPSEVELSDALWRAGLDPESLTAAGVSGTAVSKVVSNVSAHLAAHPDDCASADAAYAAARGEEDELRRSIQSGLASDEEVAAYPAAKAALELAEASRSAAVQAIFDAGVAELTDAQSTGLSNIRANSSWRLPKQYLCVNRTQEEWVDLREALANPRISADYEEDPHPDCVAMVGSCDADASVAAASVDLSTKLSANQATWDAAVGK